MVLSQTPYTGSQLFVVPARVPLQDTCEPIETSPQIITFWFRIFPCLRQVVLRGILERTVFGLLSLQVFVSGTPKVKAR